METEEKIRDLTGKVALVTGSTTGIGLAIAEEMLARGANVMFNGLFIGETADDQRAAFLQKIEAYRVQYPDQHVGFTEGDVTKRSDVLQMVTNTAAGEAQDKFPGNGRIDILVNSAGIHPASVQKPFSEVSAEDFNRVMAVNFFGVVDVTRAAQRYFAREGTTILNISSVHGLVGSPERTAYCSAKHALEGFSKTLNAELQQVNPAHKSVTICPAFVKTDLALKPVQQRAQALVEKGIEPEEADVIASKWRLQHQKGKWIELDTVAQTCADIAAGRTHVGPDRIKFKPGKPVKLDHGYVKEAVNGVVTFRTIEDIAEPYIQVKADAAETTRRAAEAAEAARQKLMEDEIRFGEGGIGAIQPRSQVTEALRKPLFSLDWFKGRTA